MAEPTPPVFDSKKEAEYRAWMKSIGHTYEQGYAVNQDYTGNDYDYRGYFLKYGPAKLNEGDHLTDEFKLPSHPTFSDESIYAVGKNRARAGHWEGEKFIPPKPPREEIGMAEPFDMEGRATLLPLRRLQTGEREWALPGVLAGLLNSASLPGRAAGGEQIQPREALDFAMNFSGAGLSSPKPAGLSMGMGGGGRRTANNVLDFKTESMTARTNRLAHSINERATNVDKLKTRIDALNRDRVGGLQTLAQNLEKLKVRLGSIGTDGLREGGIKPAELALKLKDQHRLTAQEARNMASEILKDYQSYVAEFQKATKLSEEYNTLVSQYSTEASGVMEMKGEYNKMLHDLYERTIGKE
jgi:hypothetical protein